MAAHQDAHLYAICLSSPLFSKFFLRTSSCLLSIPIATAPCTSKYSVFHLHRQINTIYLSSSPQWYIPSASSQCHTHCAISQYHYTTTSPHMFHHIPISWHPNHLKFHYHNASDFSLLMHTIYFWGASIKENLWFFKFFSHNIGHPGKKCSQCNWLQLSPAAALYTNAYNMLFSTPSWFFFVTFYNMKNTGTWINPQHWAPSPASFISPR